MNDVPANDRHVAMVFQSYALYRHMTAYDKMAFALDRTQHNLTHERSADSGWPFVLYSFDLFRCEMGALRLTLAPPVPR
jgi:ABC-type polar amino acid transport system ATPase subunit